MEEQSFPVFGPVSWQEMEASIPVSRSSYHSQGKQRWYHCFEAPLCVFHQITSYSINDQKVIEQVLLSLG